MSPMSGAKRILTETTVANHILRTYHQHQDLANQDASSGTVTSHQQPAIIREEVIKQHLKYIPKSHLFLLLDVKLLFPDFSLPSMAG